MGSTPKPAAVAADARKLVHRSVRKAKRQVGKQLRSRGWAPVTETARKIGAHGVVETFTRDAIGGWVELAAGGKPVRITLHLEDLQVAGTWANDPIGRTGDVEIRGFRFVLKDVWTYAAEGERLTVRADGVALPIAGVGSHVRATQSGRGTIGTLKRKLNSGHVFSRKGRLQLSKSLDEAWQSEVLDFYGKLRATVRDALGLDLFVMYGSLLGAVREGGFIGHDDDFDVAVIVDAATGREAIEQLKKLAFALIDAGYDVEGRRTAVHVHHRDNPKLRIDIFHLYFDAAGVLQFAFGIAGDTEIRKENWQGLTEQKFGPSTVLVPVIGEAMVETVYGAGWRVPNPGFNWDTDRAKRARDAIVPLDDVEEIYWANFYAKVEYTSGSTFQEWVDARDGMTEHVVDIGCGDGRDSYAFGQAGRHVTGLDRSHIGVRHADSKAHDMGMYPRVQFQACDVGEAGPLTGVLSGAVERAGAAAVTFYARFFLHSIPEDVQETLMTTVAAVARPGDKFAAEFRTTADAELAKVHTKHYRRFQDGWAFGVALRERYGFDVEFEVEDTGFSPYKDEDPVLYRVVATKR